MAPIQRHHKKTSVNVKRTTSTNEGVLTDINLLTSLTTCVFKQSRNIGRRLNRLIFALWHVVNLHPNIVSTLTFSIAIYNY